MPRPRGIFTTLSSASGPGVSKRCLPMNRAPPTATANTTSTVKIALPTITSGCRTRFERRFGDGTRSGSSAARGLRGGLLLGGGGGTGAGPAAKGPPRPPLDGGRPDGAAARVAPGSGRSANPGGGMAWPPVGRNGGRGAPATGRKGARPLPPGGESEFKRPLSLSAPASSPQHTPVRPSVTRRRRTADLTQNVPPRRESKNISSFRTY